jgi:hypothetical protein
MAIEEPWREDDAAALRAESVTGQARVLYADIALILIESVGDGRSGAGTHKPRRRPAIPPLECLRISAARRVFPPCCCASLASRRVVDEATPGVDVSGTHRAGSPKDCRAVQSWHFSGLGAFHALRSHNSESSRLPLPE